MHTVFHSYVLYNEDTKSVVCDELSKTVILYHTIELALIAANKSVIRVSVKPSTTKVTIQPS